MIDKCKFVEMIEEEANKGEGPAHYNASYGFMQAVVKEIEKNHPQQYTFEHLQLLYMCAMKPKGKDFSVFESLDFFRNNAALKSELEIAKNSRTSFGIVGSHGGGGDEVCDKNTDISLIHDLVKFYIGVYNAKDDQEAFDLLKQFTNKFDFLKVKGFGISKYTGILHCLRPNVFPFMRGNPYSAYKAYIEDFRLWDNTGFKNYPNSIEIVRKMIDNKINFAVVQYVADSNKKEIPKEAIKKEVNGKDGSGVDAGSGEALDSNSQKLPWNFIVFGAPGTGKSYSVEKARDKYFEDDRYKRVTFYPSYSYAKFVGAYKPTESGNTNNPITYKFVPGPFLEMYVLAKKMYSQLEQNDVEEDGARVLLIIEEINRAEAAAVFGDMFQLLDRDSSGKSVYKIDSPIDVRKYLEEQGVENPDIIELPPNMYIWATMNSADQGVYPLDTAFKRRWEYSYVGINENNFELTFNATSLDFNWDEVRKIINNYLSKNLRINEDKLMGYYFLGSQTVENFINKVIMYLFEDAARMFRNKLFYDDMAAGFNANSYGTICEKFKNAQGIDRLRIFADSMFNTICQQLKQPATAPAGQSGAQNQIGGNP